MALSDAGEVAVMGCNGWGEATGVELIDLGEVAGVVLIN